MGGARPNLGLARAKLDLVYRFRYWMITPSAGMRMLFVLANPALFGAGCDGFLDASAAASGSYRERRESRGPRLPL
jgi:hypothetical protein